MRTSQETPPTEITDYEGLVRATAGRYVSIMAGAAMDFDDLCQVFRLSVWKALEAFDPAKARQPIEGYVFMCVRNRAKDLVKYRQEEHRQRDPLLIEDVAPTVNGNGAIRDAFDRRYFCSEEEEAFATVLDEPPLVPSTLSTNERRVLSLLYNEYRQAEIAPILALTPSQVKTAVKGIREKMADWCPAPSERLIPSPA